MNSHSLPRSLLNSGLTLGGRAIAVAALLFLEKVFLNLFVDFQMAQTATGAATLARHVQHFGLRFLVTLALALALFSYVQSNARLLALNAAALHIPVRLRWLAVSLALLAPQAFLLSSLYAHGTAVPDFTFRACLCLLLAAAGTLALVFAAAPLTWWIRAARALGVIWLYAISAALVATLAIVWVQSLWGPTAFLTFELVHGLLIPFIPSLQANPHDLILSTNRFAVQVSDICSGLEGLGLMLAFCCAWLLFFRKEYRFPRAFLLIPAGLALIFALNVVRIAALVLIGHLGYPSVAEIGFHSQAGWIAFNLAACTIAFATRRSRWFSRSAQVPDDARADNPTAAYLVPFLAILAAGMVARAASAGFENFDCLRLLAGAAALVAFRNRLGSLDWHFSWRGPLAGALVFGLWMLVAQFVLSPTGLPTSLAEHSSAVRELWIGGRFLTGVLIVPVAEELAFRGFLLRRLLSRDFESVPFTTIGWWPLIVSSIVFGLGHGAMSLPAIAAGFIYGGLLIHTGRMGEAVSAHATTNLLIALTVLVWGQWQLW